MSHKPQAKHKYSLLIYLLLANGITWLLWIPGLIAELQKEYIMPNFDTYHLLFETGFENSQHLYLSIAFFFGVYGPLIGGLVATWMDGGREALAEWWGRITRWRIGGNWYLTAILITFLVAAIPVTIFGLIGGFAPSNFPFVYILGLLFVQLLRSGFGEEPGWRGFLLPRLQALFQGDKYIWVLGLIWSIWHWPIVIARTMAMIQDATLPQMVITILVSLAGNAMAIIGETYIYVWLYNKTQSVFLSIVFHAFSNIFVTWLTSFLAEPQAAGLAIALMPWAIVIFMQKRLGKENFPGNQTELAG
ncbi:MAG: CPBP family intramembrane glutamic endopeptidase [Anaerolineales bacterium]